MEKILPIFPDCIKDLPQDIANFVISRRDPNEILARKMQGKTPQQILQAIQNNKGGISKEGFTQMIETIEQNIEEKKEKKNFSRDKNAQKQIQQMKMIQDTLKEFLLQPKPNNQNKSPSNVDNFNQSNLHQVLEKHQENNQSLLNKREGKGK